jgi:hypothetical protein
MRLMKRIKNKIVGPFGNVIFQEGNQIPFLSSIIKLEFGDMEFVQFSTVPDQLCFRI